MGVSTITVASRALLLVENDVEEAFRFSRLVKAAEVDCDFYAVAGMAPAKRYLLAAESDADCLPAMIIVSTGIGAPEVAGLLEWIAAREILRECSLLLLGEERASEGRSLARPVTVDQLRKLLAAHFPPAATTRE